MGVLGDNLGESKAVSEESVTGAVSNDSRHSTGRLRPTILPDKSLDQYAKELGVSTSGALRNILRDGICVYSFVQVGGMRDSRWVWVQVPRAKLEPIAFGNFDTLMPNVAIFAGSLNIPNRLFLEGKLQGLNGEEIQLRSGTLVTSFGKLWIISLQRKQEPVPSSTKTFLEVDSCDGGGKLVQSANSSKELTWEEIEIVFETNFQENRYVRIVRGKISAKHHVSELKLENKTSPGKLNRIGLVLQSLALLPVGKYLPAGNLKLSKDISDLRRVLKRYFSLPGNPFQSTPESGSYKPRFRVIIERADSSSIDRELKKDYPTVFEQAMDIRS